MKKLKDFINLIEEEQGRRNKKSTFKAIFVTGGPGSGKDIVIRKAINEFKIVEFNHIQAKDYLNDKQTLSEQSDDFRKESIRTRQSLIINSPADDYSKISSIKEELDELGYDSMMIFVATTNEVSKDRNSLLSKSMNESVRQEKWDKSQDNKFKLSELFDNFIVFDNTNDIHSKKYDILEINRYTKQFLNITSVNETVTEWLNNNNDVDVNIQITSLFKENVNVKKDSKFIQKANIKGKSCGHTKILADNNCTTCQMQRKAGKIDDVRDGDVKSNGGYAFRTQYEENNPKTTTRPEAKKTSFSKDKETGKKITTVGNTRINNPNTGIGSTYDSRGTAGLVGGVGLGREQVESTDLKIKKYVKPSVNFKNMNTTSTSGGGQEFSTTQSGTGQSDGARMGNNFVGEKKDFKSFRKSLSTKEAIDGPGEISMGVGGVLSGAGNKEGMDTYSDTFRNIKNDYSTKNKNNKGVK